MLPCQKLLISQIEDTSNVYPRLPPRSPRHFCCLLSSPPSRSRYVPKQQPKQIENGKLTASGSAFSTTDFA